MKRYMNKHFQEFLEGIWEIMKGVTILLLTFVFLLTIWLIKLSPVIILCSVLLYPEEIKVFFMGS